MLILVCGASGAEAKACAQGIKHSGRADMFEVLQTGVGFERCRQTLERRLSTGRRPDLIVSSGLAGAISADVPIDTWVTALGVYSIDPSNDNDLNAIPLTRLRHSLHGVRGCNFVSTDELTEQSSDKAKIYKRIPQPVAVDMESVIIAEVAQEHGIDFMVLRLISDTPAEPLPRFVSKIAASMAEQKLASRVVLALQGAREAIKDPQGVLHMVKGGHKWSLLLRDGWRRYAEDLAKLNHR